ncbi:hypothetical protein GCM10009672_13010 [Nesterenkonia lutea]
MRRRGGCAEQLGVGADIGHHPVPHSEDLLRLIFAADPDQCSHDLQPLGAQPGEKEAPQIHRWCPGVLRGRLAF